MSQEYILRDGKIFRRNTIEVDMGNQEDLFKQFLTDINHFPLVINEALPYYHQHLKRTALINLLSVNKEIYVVFHLPEFAAKTTYMPSRGAFYNPILHADISDTLYPNWREDTALETIEHSITLPGLMLVVKPESNPENLSLFMVKDGCLYSPPIPNIYEHGKVCMGRDYTPYNRGKTVLEFAKECLNEFLTIPPSSDLFYTSFYPLYALDSATKKSKWGNYLLNDTPQLKKWAWEQAMRDYAITDITTISASHFNILTNKAENYRGVARAKIVRDMSKKKVNLTYAKSLLALHEAAQPLLKGLNPAPEPEEDWNYPSYTAPQQNETPPPPATSEITENDDDDDSPWESEYQS